ncbi:hypothetical protein ABEB36_009132 [Hypothenemus hampei]|uniref:ABC transporter domain-containing protein n=1 Tax=Hypothenemus hampei TaxID=57062 RepID=A0ABD1EPA4_HYPHA
MALPQAIKVNNLKKAYGSKRILDGISMKVEQGTIFGLLGASGCGKTTLINCIVGTKKPDSGDVWICNYTPDGTNINDLTLKLGYMPQELALIDEFSIKDTLYYFGTIYKMKPEKIKERHEYLAKLLDLPDANKYLKHCSGGQKRRVSFAVALIHNPEILILDEPTVGVDPILREKIWNHMKEIVNENRTTVIITTHYIEEARAADVVAFMRNGKLLSQDSPENLLAIFQKESLEEIFLSICQEQQYELQNEVPATQNVSQSSINSLNESVIDNYGSTDELRKSSDKEKKHDKGISMSSLQLHPYRMKALINKNWKQFYRNIGGILFLITFPICQMWFFVNSVGTEPKQLKLGIVNNESMTTLCENFDWNSTAIYEDNDCHFRNLTCRFLNYLEHPMFDKILYHSIETAIEGVKHGEIIGVLYMPANFSETFEERIRLGKDSDDWIVNYGELKVYMDMTNKFTGVILATKMFDLFTKFQEELFQECHLQKKISNIPIQENYLYVKKDAPLTISVTPGMAVLLVFLLGSTMTSQIIIKEKLDGVWDRSIIAGVSSLEITLSHLSIQSIIMLVECIEVFIMIVWTLNVNIVGNYLLLFFITYLAGVCGMAFGFFVSTFCQSLGEANIFCTGLYVPMTVICGIIWPIEAMPVFLRWFSLFLPCTLGIMSFRNVMTKGWNLWNFQVYNGIGLFMIWTIFFGIASIWLIKIKR